MGERRPLVTVTKNDLIRQTFRSGGKGGQNQNKVESGVRFIHEASGARGESREYRTQLQNERAAFLRLTETKAFQTWIRIESMKKMGEINPETIAAHVEEQLRKDFDNGLVLVEEY